MKIDEMTFLTLLSGWVTGPKCGTYVTPNGGSFAHDIRPVTYIIFVAYPGNMTVSHIIITNLAKND